MPCHAAITDKVIVLRPDMEVEAALKELKKKNLEFAAVVDEDGILLGLFSHQYLMKNLLPVSVAMADGIQLDVTVKAAPGIAKRLRKVYPAKVSEVMDRKIHAVYPQTPIWEGVNALINYGSPVFVVEDDKGKFMGVITSASALDELQRMQESEAT
jgi:CBS-domain-containing membrane protein